MILALVAAFMHASLGALQKGRYDPWLVRGAIDTCAGLMCVPLVLFVVPPPGPELMAVFPGVMLVRHGGAGGSL